MMNKQLPVQRYIKKALSLIFKGFNGMVTFVGRSWMHFACAVQGVLLVCVLGFWLISLVAEKGGQKFSKDSLPPAPVEAQKVYTGKFEQTSILAGSVQAPSHVVLKSPIEGRIKKVVVPPGQNVQKGAVLFVFEDAIYKAEVQESEAQLAVAEARYKRDVALGKKSARSAKDVEESAGQVGVQRALIAKRRAMLDRTVVRAPFSGRVGIHSLTEGSYLRQGDEIVALTEPESLNLDFCIPERYLDSVNKGDEVRFSVDSAEGQVFSAFVSHMDAQAHPVRHCVRCRAQVDSPGTLLRHGLYARVQVVTRVNDGVIIAPQAAVETRGTTNYVYVVDGGKAHYRSVKVGGRSGDNVEVLRGLSANEDVIIAGQIRVQDGFPVFVVSPKVLST